MRANCLIRNIFCAVLIFVIYCYSFILCKGASLVLLYGILDVAAKRINFCHREQKYLPRFLLLPEHRQRAGTRVEHGAEQSTSLPPAPPELLGGLTAQPCPSSPSCPGSVGLVHSGKFWQPTVSPSSAAWVSAHLRGVSFHLPCRMIPNARRTPYPYRLLLLL